MGTHVSPEGAARRSGRSRRTVTRALKSGALSGFRDNAGFWQITVEDVDAWARTPGPPERHAVNAPLVMPAPAQDVAHAVEAAELRGQLAVTVAERDGLRARLEEVRSDRDAWRAQATRSWWARLFGR